MLTIQSHEVPKGSLVASVAIEQVVEGETTTYTITWDWTHPVATRNVAIAGAKQQAIDWIDSQSPPPVITCKWWQIEPTASLADTTTAGVRIDEKIQSFELSGQEVVGAIAI